MVFTSESMLFLGGSNLLIPRSEGGKWKLTDISSLEFLQEIREGNELNFILANFPRFFLLKQNLPQVNSFKNMIELT